MLLILGAARRASEGIEQAKSSQWIWSARFFNWQTINWCEDLGILGMGRVGRAVAKLARAFGMKIHYHNRSKLSADT